MRCNQSQEINFKKIQKVKIKKFDIRRKIDFSNQDKAAASSLLCGQSNELWTRFQKLK